MPIFYFHTPSDLDDEGTPLPTVDDARHQAVALLAGVLQNGAQKDLWAGSPVKVWVTDRPLGEGTTLLQIEVTARAPNT
jgi:hypothetical protein